MLGKNVTQEIKRKLEDIFNGELELEEDLVEKRQRILKDIVIVYDLTDEEHEKKEYYIKHTVGVHDHVMPDPNEYAEVEKDHRIQVQVDIEEKVDIEGEDVEEDYEIKSNNFSVQVVDGHFNVEVEA